MGGTPLESFMHPERAIYILGAEDHGLPSSVVSVHKTLSLSLCLSLYLSLILSSIWTGMPLSCSITCGARSFLQRSCCRKYRDVRQIVEGAATRIGIGCG